MYNKFYIQGCIMISLEYVGNKPIITPNGVSFIASKHDKYDYIEPASHLLQTLLDTNEDKDVIKVIPQSIYTQSKIFDILATVNADYESDFQKAIQEYTKKIDEEKEDVEQYKTLEPIEKETLLNNYDFMRKSRIQRATNKVVYENIINECVSIIYARKIQEIDTPFSENFLHVCNSIGSSMEIAYKNVRSDVKVKLDGGQPYTKVALRYV